ncbi:MAG: DsbA family protein [Aggregatilineales bacterium]
MSKVKTSKQRVSVQRRQKTTQMPIMIVGVVGLAVVIGLLVVLSNRGAVASTASQTTQIRDATLGNANARVTLIEYGAYSCPSCRAWHKAHIVDNLLSLYGDKLRFIFRDFPVITPPYDRMAAATARCALDQGQDKFWAFHDALYTSADASYSQEDLLQLGGKTGLNVDQLRACVTANTYVGAVQQEENQAHNYGFPGTPSFLVNSQPVFDASPESLKTAIDQALRS